MIVFDLCCDNGHPFEGWFEDAGAYETQQAGGLILCPICSSARVAKVPSTFAIRSAPAHVPAENVPHSIARIAKKISEFIENNFENVGSDFAKEALKIHYGAAEPRNIRGVSTHNEEAILKQEGVAFYKIPLPPTTKSDG